MFNSLSPHMKAHGPKLFKKQKHSGEIQEQDFKYMYEKPEGDPGFSVEHNRKVIEDTIKATKEREKRLKKEYLNKVEERVDAGVSLLKALASGKYTGVDSNTAALRHFGRKELTRLRGEEIKQELMSKIAMTRKLMNN